MSTSATGHFVWHDLMTKDVAAAARFYQSVFGWGTQPFEGGDKPYTMWTVEGSPIGGVMNMAPGLNLPPHWIGYVQVNDVSAACKQVESLGGNVHKEPTPIPDVGVFAWAGRGESRWTWVRRASTSSPPWASSRSRAYKKSRPRWRPRPTGSTTRWSRSWTKP
jgi:predicted enzyme related to lactoylglutathione lyase